MKKFLFVLVLFFMSLCVNATNPLNDFRNNPLLENATISLLVKSLTTWAVVCDYRSNNSVVPASTMKLVTTATALEVLGADFRFKTKLEIIGKLGADGVLNGDLYIRGGGDPTLGSEKLGDSKFLDKWVEAVKGFGIRKITGRIIADAGLFDNEGVNVKWSWEDIGNYYAAGVYGLAYCDNAYKLVLKTGAIGSVPQILRVVPEIPNLQIDNQLKCAAITFDSAYFYGAPHSDYRSVTGLVPANRSEFITKGDIPNPGLLLAQHFKALLQERGVPVGGTASDIVDSNFPGELVYTHESPPLSEIINEVNVHSNNHFAEHVFKYLGLQNVPVASNKNAVQVIKTFWKSKGLSVNQLFQQDGSGLAESNAVSASFFVELLTYMKMKSVNGDVFYNSLPVAGENGTLKTFLLKTPLQGKVHAKSGTISRVKSYAGYVDVKGKSYAFAILVNNANGTSKAVTQKIESFLVQLFASAK